MVSLFSIESLIPKIIENGLKVWVKSKCLRIKVLKIKINSTNIEIIKGNIKSVQTIAEDLIFKSLEIENIDLSSSEIKVEFSIKEKKVIIKNKFRVDGSITFSDIGLTNSLLNKEWIWLGNKISSDLINLKNFEQLTIKDNLIFIKGYNNLKESSNIIA